MDDQTDDPGEPTRTMRLRRPTVEDKIAMLRVMAPFQNRHFPGGLRSDRVQLAVLDDEIIGFVGWEGDEVLALYAAEQWRGKRWVGTALLAAAEAAIRQAGHRQIRIVIDADADRAHRFYQRHDYVTDYDRREPDIAWMTKALA